MLTENFIAATQAVNKPSAHLSSALKDVGIFQYEYQPQTVLRHGFKKTSIKPNCISISDSHVFAAQADKAVIHVYNRGKGNQEATVPFPDKICSLAYAKETAVLIIGTTDGKLMLWEVATGRISTSAASHLEPITSLVVTGSGDTIISGSAETSIHVWSLPKLVSFSSVSDSYQSSSPSNEPLRTFSQQRAATTALAVGHSHIGTNFAVSTAADRTCYVWHIDTCQLLRTILTPSISISIVLDPADRAVYLGNEDGTIQSVEFLTSSKRSIYNTQSSTPIQLGAGSGWKSSSSNLGATECLTLSYDGTSLLSGHREGLIMKWDVAKQRVLAEVANLNQPVTAIEMLVPDGLRHSTLDVVISTVTKPRLELNAESTESTIGLPASYSLTTQVVRRTSKAPRISNQAESPLSGGLFPGFMLDEALRAMTAKSADVSSAPGIASASTDSIKREAKIQSLEEENALLQRKLAQMQKSYDESRERHLRRKERRDTISQQRRESYFAAKEKGKDGDAAMLPFQKQMETIDAESDEEELAASNAMEVDG